MSHTIVGIDLGSHAVKFAPIETGFRQSTVRVPFAEPVPPGDAPLAERQAEALARGLERLPPEATIYVAVPGELLTLRVLDLPFSDPRKIDQVVGYELEGQIVHTLSDVVVDHRVLRTPGPEGTAVLAVAARLDDIGGLLADLAALKVDPHALYAGPLTYQALLDDTGGPQAGLPAWGGDKSGPIPVVDEADVPEAELEPQAPVSSCRVVLDIGHLRTNICVIFEGEAVFARTVVRGGAALTAAIMRALEIDELGAEEIKMERGFLASASIPAQSVDAARMDAILKEAMTPLLRDVRQTLASVRARVRVPISQVLLTGGSARLAGLPAYLEEALDIPVVVWSGARESFVPHLEEEEDLTSPGVEETRFALASAVAWSGVRAGKPIDLRKGPFVYKANFSILRQKALHLGLLAAAVVVAITIDTTMALGRLRKEGEQLTDQLRTQTQELFGQPMLAGSQVTRLLKRSFKDEMAPIPKATAYDLLGEISRRVPGNKDVKLDIFELDIRPNKVIIRGTVDSAAAVDELQTKLGEIKCFEEITKGSITEVSGGAKNFTLTIATNC